MVISLKNVVKGIALVTQIGISVIVPVFLCVFLGNKLDEWLDTSYFFIIFLILGFITAYRNVYYLTKSFYAKDKKQEEKELKYFNDLKNSNNDKK